jgi:hypothetical protein
MGEFTILPVADGALRSKVGLPYAEEQLCGA